MATTTAPVSLETLSDDGAWAPLAEAMPAPAAVRSLVAAMRDGMALRAVDTRTREPLTLTALRAQVTEEGSR